ncbi:MFS transporter [Streptomyces lunaelactis]|uniref:MFS transporter n=1 Tax=Streptomyces lunaelactis TaxID=1535768 RepID=UPI00158577B2|nr:MFS transporter [Streptomyces lunaelactis]NUK60748.1 MFS transporter [Streptomyces lunaelactis]NUK69401.1 MFS transporter [Streptomyces lunaelactis]NUK80951.1 MFS transporter [Streptomyces lunaelactis]
MPQHEQEPPGRIPAGGGRRLLLAVSGVLSFVAMLDMSIVNIALADIARDLDVSASTAQWAVLGYQLPVVALLLPAGRWLDGAGLRSAVLVSTAGFAVCGVVAALAPWAAWLIGARIAQGAFGAALFVLMPVLAFRAVPPELRARAMSVPATLGPLGAVTGPAVGGVLLDQFGWRAVFLVKLPLCVAAFVVAHRVMPRDGRLPAPDRRSLSDAGLVGTAVAFLLLALTFAPGAPAWLLLGLAAPPLLVWWLRGPGGRPVAAVLRASGTYAVNAAVLALAAGFAAMHYVVALRLQRDDGFSATATGLTVLAFPLAMGLMGPLGGRLADRYGARVTAVAGAALTTAGLALLVPLGAGDGWSTADVAWRLALAGAGMGLYGGPAQALVMGAAPPGATATAGSVVQLARSLGFALGPALASATWGFAGPAGDGAGAGAALTLAATAAGLAVVLLALRRTPSVPAPPGTTADTAPAARN